MMTWLLLQTAIMDEEEEEGRTATATTNAFHFFPQLPPEIRDQIWRTVVLSDWSLVKYTRDGYRTRLVPVGWDPFVVRGVCREAHWVVRGLYEKVQLHPGFDRRGDHAWINWDTVIFDLGADFEACYHVNALCEGLRRRMARVAISHRQLGYTHDCLARLARICHALLSVVIFDPGPDAFWGADVPRGAAAFFPKSLEDRHYARLVAYYRGDYPSQYPAWLAKERYWEAKLKTAFETWVTRPTVDWLPLC